MEVARHKRNQLDNYRLIYEKNGFTMLRGKMLIGSELVSPIEYRIRTELRATPGDLAEIVPVLPVVMTQEAVKTE